MDNSRYPKEEYYRTEHEEILAFGYSCKLFRDDEKAIDIDRGIHLIPCMADSALMIDRFDVRGALTDLREAESKGNGNFLLTEVEALEEKACEYESYCDYPVYNKFNTEERLLYDEEQKRIQMELAADVYTYNQVNFSYMGENYIEETNEEQMADSSVQMVESETFIPPPELHIPDGIEIPKTIKQNKIIMKTADFVTTQGAQMEIILMTKQAINASFNFLSFDNELNPYYKYISHLIKTKRLKIAKEGSAEGNNEDQQNNVQFNIPQVTPDLTPGAKTTPKPSTANCTYLNLISKIREKQKASGVEESEIYSPTTPSSPITHAGVVNVPIGERTPIVAQSASSLPLVGLVDYPSFNQTAGYESSEEEESPFNPKVTSIIEGSQVYDYNKMKWPSPELQMVIDKLACYIVKNGHAFRELVQNRRDPRFEFLNSGNEYNPYFQCKLQLYSEIYGDTFNYQTKGSKNIVTPVKTGNIQRTKNSAKGRAISFSIKSKDVEVPLSSHTTFPVESSTSEEDGEDDDEKEARRIARDQKRLERKNKEEKARKEREALMLMARKEQNQTKAEEVLSDNDDLYDIFKYAQNMAKEEMENSNSPKKTQSKQMERKMKAAAFLGNLQKSVTPNGSPPIYGPHLPVVLKSNVDLLLPVEELVSSNSSNHSDSNNERLKNSTSPVPSISEDSSRLWLVKEISKSPVLPSPKIEDSQFIGELQEEPTIDSRNVSPKEEWSNVRHKKSRKRSVSRSPEPHRERKKRKKSHSSHKRKKHHSRSRSRDRSKSHRSSHKKRKHVSHKDKSRSKKKKHRRYRSPSLSSLTSESSKSSSNFPSDSDSEVQVISTPVKSKPAPSSSRSSSIISLTDVKVSTSTVQSGGDTSSPETNGTSTITDNNITSKANLPIYIAEEENSSNVSDVHEADKTPGFNPATSSAMARITMGIRAKLDALLKKDTNL